MTQLQAKKMQTTGLQLHLMVVVHDLQPLYEVMQGMNSLVAQQIEKPCQHVQQANSLPNQNVVPGGDFDMLMPDGMNQQGATSQEGGNYGGSRSDGSVALEPASAKMKWMHYDSRWRSICGLSSSGTIGGYMQNVWDGEETKAVDEWAVNMAAIWWEWKARADRNRISIFIQNRKREREDIHTTQKFILDATETIASHM